MRNTARSHFLEAVLPAWSVFAPYYNAREIGFRTDTRNAALIAGALRDVPEHLAYDNSGGSNVAEIRQRFSSDSPYVLVCNFGDCWKHRELNRPNRLFDSLDDIQECVATTKFEDAAGVYYRNRTLLEVKLKDGSYVDLGRALYLTLRAVGSHLIGLGVIPAMPKITELLPNIPARADARYKGEFVLLGESKEYFSVQFRNFVCVDGNDLTQPSQSHRFGTFDIRCEQIIRESPFSD